MANARKAALSVLDNIENNGAYSNIALDNLFSNNDFKEVDRRFISATVYGVTDRRITLDYILSKYIKKGADKLPVTVKNALRMAVYQMLYMDKVPTFAAVNETVKIIKSSKYSYLSSFVNAVLRNVSKGDNTLPQKDDINSMSVRYSCAQEIVKMLVNDYGIDVCKAVLENALTAPPVFLRVNTLKTNEDELIANLMHNNVCCEKTGLKNAIKTTSPSGVINSKEHKNGLFYVEDLACQTAVSLIAARPDERILDSCSAPGSKAFTMALDMQNRGEIVCCDIYAARLLLVNESAEKLGIDIIKTKVADSTVYEDMGLFDAVLCDVPCSGYGVIRRKPEIKYKTEDTACLTKTQLEILTAANLHLKDNGRILYSTCTLNKAENEGVVSAFLEKHKNYKLETERTFLPHIDGTDGFYCALLKKSG